MNGMQIANFIIGIVGFPSVATIIGFIIALCKKVTILMKAQQAQMRSQLLDQYHNYEKKGWISEDDMQDWENQYQAYHKLGANGVLDKRREALMNLPTYPPAATTTKSKAAV